MSEEIGCKDVEWSHVAPDSVKWQVLVNILMNIWVP